MSWKNDDWQAKQEQFRKSAGLKECLVREAQQLAHSDDFRSAGARMKQLGSEFKNAGFAGKDQNQRLWDEFSQARSAFYDRRNQYYERLNIEARDNAAQKRRIISELQSLLGVEDFREAGQRVKALHSDWKSVGFAGREENQLLNDQYYAARNEFYENSKRHWEQLATKMELNKNDRLRLVQQAEFIADHPDPRSMSNDMRALLQVWRDQRGPLKKEDREELNRRFWSAKDRFYSRRDAQFAQGQTQWASGKGARSAIQDDPAWRPKDNTDAIRHLEQAIRDKEQAVRDADAHYEKVRSQGRSWLLPSKQNERIAKAEQWQWIQREELDKLYRRLSSLRNRN